MIENKPDVMESVFPEKERKFKKAQTPVFWLAIFSFMQHLSRNFYEAINQNST